MHPPSTRRDRAWPPPLRGIAALGAVALFLGCQPDIGDPCTTSIDCSQTGDRLCDTSQPDGYCTIFNCEPDKCPSGSVCIGFGSQIDARCGNIFDPRWSRFERTFCLDGCETAKDCRDGYSCVEPVDRRSVSIDITSEFKASKVCFPASTAPTDVPAEPPPACFPSISAGSGSSTSSASTSSASTSSASSASSGSSSSSSGTGGAGGAGSSSSSSSGGGGG